MSFTNSKEVKIKLWYKKSCIDKQNGLYLGGVQLPKYMKELKINIDNDEIFDFDKDQFVQTGKKLIEITGTNRALKELGKFFINISLFKTKDDDFHEHLDDLTNENGEASCNITIRKQN